MTQESNPKHYKLSNGKGRVVVGDADSLQDCNVNVVKILDTEGLDDQKRRFFAEELTQEGFGTKELAEQQKILCKRVRIRDFGRIHHQENLAESVVGAQPQEEHKNYYPEVSDEDKDDDDDAGIFQAEQKSQSFSEEPHYQKEAQLLDAKPVQNIFPLQQRQEQQPSSGIFGSALSGVANPSNSIFANFACASSNQPSVQKQTNCDVQNLRQMEHRQAKELVNELNLKLKKQQEQFKKQLMRAQKKVNDTVTEWDCTVFPINQVQVIENSFTVEMNKNVYQVFKVAKK